MTKIVNGILFIEPTEPDKCELCGKVEELRPIGPNNKNICFDCGMKDEEAIMKKMQEQYWSKMKKINPNDN